MQDLLHNDWWCKAFESVWSEHSSDSRWLCITSASAWSRYPDGNNSYVWTLSLLKDNALMVAISYVWPLLLLEVSVSTIVSSYIRLLNTGPCLYQLATYAFFCYLYLYYLTVMHTKLKPSVFKYLNFVSIIMIRRLRALNKIGTCPNLGTKARNVT